MLLCGIDVGTQSLKAVICDEQLALRGAYSASYPVHYPQPGRAEQDPRDWEAALAPAIAGALAAAGATADDIGALAIVGQLDGCIAVDDACAPLHNALIWQDRRAIDQTTLVRAPQLFALAGQVADPSHFAPKLVWLREQLGSARRPARYHQPVSYLVERLTGVAVMDPSLASTCMMMELSSGTWAPALLDAFTIDELTLPAIRPTCAVAGELTAEGSTLTGLRAGTLVAVGTGDDFSNPLGAGIVGPGPIAVTIGTAEVVGALAATPILDRAPEPMVETHAYPTGGFFVENPGWLSGGAIKWACQLLGIASSRAFDELAAKAPSGAAGVTFVPALAGAMTPVWRPHARGTLHGLAAGHGPAHIARAVLEGLAFACRDVIDRLGTLDLPRERVVLLGGGAHSRVWAQIRADVIGLRHETVANPDTSPIGAAMIASVAAGIHADLIAAAALIAQPRELFRPSDRLDDEYERYRKLVTQLAPLSTAPWR